MPRCRDVTHWLSEGLDADLSWWQRWQLRLHLLLCGACARFGRQLHLLTEALRGRLADTRPASSAFPALSAKARERIRRALEAADG